MSRSLKNKTVFITGASAGIGKACAEQFAAQGANLILTARHFERISHLYPSHSKMRSLRIDLKGHKLRVSEIDPGMVKTEFSEKR